MKTGCGPIWLPSRETLVPETPSLFESLLSGKRGLGADYRYEHDTLEVKTNAYGIKGVFARHAVSRGDEIISVTVVNGSLTPFRGYEEAQQMLSRLGADRFNVSQEFAIACAMYLRCTDTRNCHTDVLITEGDLAASYAGSPMTSYDSLARARLLNSNNREAIEYATLMDSYVEALGVRPDLFRAILGYISSRAWKGVGIIPVLDWFNSSYGGGANCMFQLRDGRFAYVAIRDIAEGEEFLWNYNNSNAVTTWFNYGYVDKERPALAFLEQRTSQTERESLEKFAARTLDFNRAKGASASSKIDECLFQSELLTPGKLANLADMQRSYANCMATFVKVRAWFRMLVLSAENDIGVPVNQSSVHDDEPLYGLAVEARAIGLMRAALAEGLQAIHARTAQFATTEIGRDIDMNPFIEMATRANALWDGALAVIQSLCQAESRDERLRLAGSALGVDLTASDNVISVLERIAAEQPSISALLVKKYGSLMG